MAENLNYASKGSVCFENDSMYCDLYGRMYTITQARNGKEPTDYDEDVQGICPDGWRLPKESEFKAAIGGNDPHVTVYAKIIGYDTHKEMYEHQNKTGLSIVFGGIHNSEPSIYWPEWDGLNIEGGIIGSNFEFDVYYHYYKGSDWGYIRDGQAENVRCVKRL